MRDGFGTGDILYTAVLSCLVLSFGPVGQQNVMAACTDNGLAFLHAVYIYLGPVHEQASVALLDSRWFL